MTLSPHRSSSVEWYTPPWVFDAIGESFDLDPASPGKTAAPWVPAINLFTKHEDGLAATWKGVVWLNPPYGRGIELWVDRMIEHNLGIALLPAQTASAWCQRAIAKARAVCLVQRRIPFLGPNRRPGYTPVAGSLLLAYGHDRLCWRLNESRLGVVVNPR